MVAQRSHGSLVCLMAAGYDVVGKPPFGFTRTDVGARLVDPERWPTVQRIYARALRTPSLAELRRDLTARDPGPFDLSTKTLGRILRNRIYVDGRWWATHGDVTLEMPPVALADPIAAVTFARVQALLRQRGPRPRPSPLANLPPHPSLLLTTPPPTGWPKP